MAKRRNFTDQFKAKVALEALRGDKTVQEIAAKHQLHPNQVSTWKRQAIDGMADVFSGGKQSGPTEADIKELHAKIGRLAVENGFFVGRAQKVSPAKKRSMVQRDHPKLSISQQCKLVSLSRSAFYYTPVGIDADTLEMMKEIDRVFTKYPFFGSRQIAAYLRREGTVVGRHRVRRLMAKMGLEAIYKRPRTSQRHPQHSVYPYLLRKMQIDRPNQVWCADITFVPVKNGFLYLVAIMDWATRKVLSWRLSNTMHADFCVEALQEAIAKYGPPEICNTDQGSQFTGSAWITTLTAAGVRISMDGRGRYLDNIFIERLWRSLKQEAIYLEEISDGFQARRVIKDWMTFYNTERPHSALDRQTPDDAYWAGLEEQKAA
ncbi:IS3 family transposase [Phaeobacter gallaeciensis]|uniref:IS3 family transposase n=1 Tax=Phaeobacter gallaeciensis TaxID=60890 RepID=A0ABD4XG06_9RHOB|nr:IS3 family transposase [Phaeobacter gallaeciensis]MDE4147191.1 IS3 family transposase [Phaeobacter gallaeciensis]MDE4168285.1 IS3 family transposase [Phaeobacter gallaeciensis]MDE4189404.1 IS3 family transposase [Phaeobacter gallaeciensis]MDE4197703.1 IS3 family transposase [Phaeobacter gallaeciensis]